MTNATTDRILEDVNGLIEEVSLGADDTKRQMMFTHLLSSLSFLSPVATISMALIGTIALSSVSMGIMGIFAIYSAFNANKSHINKLYDLFFEPHSRLVMEFDKFLKGILENDKHLSKKYKQMNIAMFKELRSSTKSLTEKHARAKYREIYRKYMNGFLVDIRSANVFIDTDSKKKFTALVKQLKSARVL